MSPTNSWSRLNEVSAELASRRAVGSPPVRPRCVRDAFKPTRPIMTQPVEAESPRGRRRRCDWESLLEDAWGVAMIAIDACANNRAVRAAAIRISPRRHVGRRSACSFARALVPGEGVEPTRLAATDFESVASANSAIRAMRSGQVREERALVNAKLALDPQCTGDGPGCFPSSSVPLQASSGGRKIELHQNMP